jgi:hypothetical protein
MLPSQPGGGLGIWSDATETGGGNIGICQAAQNGCT